MIMNGKGISRLRFVRPAVELLDEHFKKTGMDNAGVHPCLPQFPLYLLGGYLWEPVPANCYFLRKPVRIFLYGRKYSSA
jgi:hypothetical protein